MPALIDCVNKTYETRLTADEGERAVVANISTISVDRDGDVVLPKGLDMTDYNKNPVVMVAHDTSSLPVGVARPITRTANGIQAKVMFAKRPETHPDGAEWRADTILSLFQQKVLRAFSIGFQIDESRPAEQKDMGRFGDGVRRIISKWRLIEVSVVPVPANQDALAMAVSKAYPNSWLMRAWNLSRPIKLDVPRPVLLKYDYMPVRIAG
jgi:HK97 family phage prohead protease